MVTGVCRNAVCPRSAGEPIERYPGPGEYCPDCGEKLDDAVPPPETTPAFDAERYHAELRANLASALFPPPVKKPPPDGNRRKRGPLVAGGLAVAIIVAATTAMLLLRSTPTRSAPLPAVRVCSSSMTHRLAADVVASYAQAEAVRLSRFEFPAGGPCDVRFVLADRAAGGELIAHDGVVAIVNPANPLAEVTEDKLRGILAGTVTDWSQTGGPAGPILVVVPDPQSDETHALTSLLHGTALASSARTVGSSTDVVRTVASAGGRRTIGIVAFSVAAPAKVLALHGAPPPSAISIADHRYPLSFDLTVASQRGGGGELASRLMEYAHSSAAQSVVVGDGLIGREGS